jgi:hypothetical protein
MKKRGLAITLIALGLMAVAGFSYAGDKPSLDLKWYGYFKFDGAYDQNLTSNGNFVIWVQPNALEENDHQLNMTINETRFGFTATGNNYNNIKVNGKLEFDLYASITGAAIAENKAMLQLRHAFFSIEKGSFKLLAGQTWDMIAPLNPSTLNYTALMGCGNIGYRRPQLSLWLTMKPTAKTDFTMAGGVFRTIGTDLTPTITLAQGEASEGSDDGTDAAIPSMQALIEVKHNLTSGGYVRFGVSGLYGDLKAETNQGNYEKYSAWTAVVHMSIAPVPSFGFSGEAFSGSNLGSYFGSILRSSEIAGLRTAGGWLSTWAQVTKKIQLTAGYGQDNPDDRDFTSGRSKNSCTYGNLRYAIVPQATIGVELSDWRTYYKNAEMAKNFRVQTAFILNF